MSLLFIDGMDHYVQAQGGNKWDIAFSMTWTSTQGRFGNGGLKSDPNNSSKYARKNIPQSSVIVIGFALKLLNALPSGTVVLASLLDGSTTQVELRLNSNGALIVYSNNVALGTASTSTLSLNIWNFVEWKVAIAASTGTNQCNVNVNNVQWLAYTAVSTKVSSNAYANVVQIGKTAFDDNGAVYDDFYICNNAGTVNNDFLGDCRIETLYPNGAGALTQFGLNGAATNWQAVSEATPDDDTSYVSSDTPGNIDTYAFGNPVGTINSVFGVQAVMRAKKDNAGSRTFTRVVRIGGTNYAGSAFSLGTDYNFFLDVIEQNPNTNAAWTSSEITALEAGVKVVS